MKIIVPQVKPGTEPGQIKSRPQAFPTHVKVMVYDSEAIHYYLLDDLLQNKITLTENQVLWVYVEGLQTIDTIKQIGNHFHLHPLALEDTVNSYQRPKIDTFNDFQFIVTKLVTVVDGELQRQQVSIYLGQQYVITFAEHANDLFGTFEKKLSATESRLRKRQADYLAYELLDYITDCFFPVLSYYSDQLDKLSTEVVERPEHAIVGKIQHLKKDLRYLKLVLWSQRDMINLLMHNELNLVRPENLIYFRDCYDHSIQEIDILESMRDSATSLIDIYLSSAANRMNQIIKVLTIVSLVFMPPTFLAGVWGMNFKHMPELNWHYGYLFAWGVMIFSSILIAYPFWRRGWFKDNK